MARVVIEKLSKTFAGPKGRNILAVTDASVTVEDGEILVLVGPSGCGKSTTLRMIAGLEEISAGTVSIDGEVINKVPPKDRDIAMVFQNYALYPHMTVRENLAFGLELRKTVRAEIDERVNAAADLLGLKDCLAHRPQELSGGERQRVAVGRAIVRKPKLFLFDEPLSNLDAQMRVQMRREIAKLHARLGATMIYVTHDQVEAMTLGNRIAVMRAGVIQQVARPMELYHSPANLFVAGFIGSPAMNFFRGTIDAEYFRAEGFELRLDAVRKRLLENYAGKEVVLGLRAENISDVAVKEAAEVLAVAEVIEPLGAETYLYARMGKTAVVARVTGELKVGESAALYFDMKRAHFFDAVTERVIG